MGNTDSSQFPFKVENENFGYNGELFRMYEGTRADNSEKVSIFSFDKKENSECVDVARHYLKNIKILRHPNILKCIDGVELANTIYIVTEPVEPLYLKEFNGNEAKSSPAFGLSQIINAVSFLNCQAGMVHGNINPQSLFITKAGDWKLGGMDIIHKHKEVTQVTRDFYEKVVPSRYHSMETAQANWSAISAADPWAIDSWSLGCLIYEIFNGTIDDPQNLNQMGAIPRPLQSAYKKLLTGNISRRLSPEKLVEDRYFRTPLIQAVEFLDQLALKNNYEKDQFFAQFSQQVDTLPPKICKYKILPQLVQSLEFGSGMSCFSSILTSVLKIGSMLTPEEYEVRVIPTVLKLFSSNERAIRVHLLTHLHEYVDHLHDDLVNSEIIGHVITGFTDAAPRLRELTVRSMVHLVPKLNEKNIKNKVIKYLSSLQTDQEPSIRTNTTYCIAKIASYLPKDVQQKVLVPAFSRSLHDRFAPARVAGLNAFTATLDIFPAPVIAASILPVLSPFTVDPVQEVRENALRCVSSCAAQLTVHSREMVTKAAEAQANAAASSGTNGEGKAREAESSISTQNQIANAAVGVMSKMGSWAVSSLKHKIMGEDGEPVSSLTNATNNNNNNTDSSNNGSSNSRSGRALSSVASPSRPNKTSSRNQQNARDKPRSASLNDFDAEVEDEKATGGQGDGWGNNDFFDNWSEDAGSDTEPVVLLLSTKKDKKKNATTRVSRAGTNKSKPKRVVKKYKGMSLGSSKKAASSSTSASSEMDGWDDFTASLGIDIDDDDDETNDTAVTQISLSSRKRPSRISRGISRARSQKSLSKKKTISVTSLDDIDKSGSDQGDSAKGNKDDDFDDWDIDDIDLNETVDIKQDKKSSSTGRTPKISSKQNKKKSSGKDPTDLSDGWGNDISELLSSSSSLSTTSLSSSSKPKVQGLKLTSGSKPTRVKKPVRSTSRTSRASTSSSRSSTSSNRASRTSRTTGTTKKASLDIRTVDSTGQAMLKSKKKDDDDFFNSFF